MKIRKTLAMMLSILLLTASCAPDAIAEAVLRPAEVNIREGNRKRERRQVKAPGASVSSREDIVRLEITGEPGLAIYADLSGDTRYDLRAGDTVEFTGLAAGRYELEVDYHDVQQGVSAFRTSVSVAGKTEPKEEKRAELITPPPSKENDSQIELITPPPSKENDSQIELITPPSKENDSQIELITPPPNKENDSQIELITPPPSKENDSQIELITPPPSKENDSQIELITPPSKEENSQIELITPPPSKENDSQIELITPPSKEENSQIELITPPPYGGNHGGSHSGSHGGRDEAEPTIRQLGAKVTSGWNWIEVKVTEADKWPLYVAVGNDLIKTARVGETVRFTDLAAGKYDIEVDYLSPVSGVSPYRSSVEIVYSYAKEISFSATGGRSGIEVIVSDASTLPIEVTIKQGRKEVVSKTIEGGVGKASFDGLSTGVYSVVVNYKPEQWGVQAKTQDDVVVTGEIKGLKIHAVKPGENVIAVTGTAHPNTDIALTTKPQTTGTVIVRSDKNGYFSANIVLPAGEYTQIKATYVADNTVYDVSRGQYTVTAMEQKPELTVDPISNKTQRVSARTSPGVKVNLRVKEYNYGQTVIADENGLLQYSLPQTYPKGTIVTFTVYYGKDNALSYVKTVTVSKEEAYIVLKYGDTGSEVKALTKRLEELGYLADDTSRYSSAVRDAVKLFQQINGLDVDGVAGVLTQRVLFSVSAIPYGASSAYPTLSRGDKGIAAVYKLQQRLKDLGYYTIAVDGIYGSGTERAVRHFQRVNGLEKTGVADSATQRLLYSSSAKAADSASAEAYKTLSRSSSYHPAVVPLQRRLKALGYEVGTVDGYFGSRTYRAVREFQKRNGLSVNGVADETTQRVLFSSAAVAASGASGSSSSSSGGVSYRLLTWGSSGEDVRRLQNALLAKGYTQVRVADGQYGQWTYDAVRAFQRDYGLAVDGIAGKDTQNALYGTKY